MLFSIPLIPGPITMTETAQDFVNTSIMCPSTTNKNINQLMNWLGFDY